MAHVASNSRLIVKNLPKHLTEERFRAHFEKKGIVTDCKIVHAREGQKQSRKFGFIGFKHEDDAKAAQKHFDKTYIDTSKVIVDFAIPYGDTSSLPRPWSRFTKGSSAYRRKEQNEKRSKKKSKKRKADDIDGIFESQKNSKKRKRREGEDTGDHKMKEFMDLAGGKNKVWHDKVHGNEPVAKPAKGSDSSSSDDSDSGEYQDMNTTPSVKSMQADVSSNSSDSDGSSDEEKPDKGEKKKKKKEKKKEKKEGESDGSSDSDSGSDSESSSSGSDDEVGPDALAKAKETMKQNRIKSNSLYTPDIGDSGRLFIRNLSYQTTEQDLREAFEIYGELDEVHVPLDKVTGVSKGFAFLQFVNPPDALMAVSNLDATTFQGRLLHILPAKPARDGNQDVDGEGLSSYQKQKQEKLQKNAANDSQAWNPLYIRADTVATAMSDSYDVNKANLLDPENKNLGLRQALGEAAIVAETKQYLIHEGVSLKALEGSYSGEIERSDRIILVKNIPYHTESSEIEATFGQFGRLGKVILPPTKTLAMVEFAQSSEAKIAFRKLAFRSFNDAPLFLEWAPVSVLSGKASGPAPSATTTTTTANGGVETMEDILRKGELEEEEVKGKMSDSTIFVKNLAFSTTESSLEELCKKAGKVRNVTIAKKRDMKKGGAILSLGYGFVEFKKREHAVKAFTKLQGVKLDGHALVIQLSKPSEDNVSSSRKTLARGKQSTKLMIRNVPFQANKQEIRELFSSFGELKSVRLPFKQGGRGHRGFAFVEFLTKEEAAKSLEALANTHLYGRHLVIDYAKEDEGIDEIREKTKHLFEKK
eukprot:TRINITY_DN2763_c0_g1_i2.p1 TRINITY_DN2763_c0_g1~~TRINITY_DN2763_c0_g1_i2.p1  ORF type:complete len:823 (+),score=242.47 TRINITY_DN2763_c0_g1_i2:26-2470(+)